MNLDVQYLPSKLLGVSPAVGQELLSLPHVLRQSLPKAELLLDPVKILA